MYRKMKNIPKVDEPLLKPTFIDLFSGCGGLSLGMTNAGFLGIFAVEKAADAFLTFRSNLLDDEADPRFAWPEWFEKKNIGIEDFLAKYSDRLIGLKGKVTVITGGPPCQGFSFAGRRNRRDPRNKLFRKYVAFVDAVRPQMIVLENVPGMKVIHGTGGKKGKKSRGRKPKSYYEKLIETLASTGYAAEGRLLDATSFGVPQRRPRLVVVGLRRELLTKLDDGFDQIFDCIESCADEQMRQMGLQEPVPAKSALSDLETLGGKLVPCTDPASPRGFEMLQYSKPTTTYQKLMNSGTDQTEMDSMRLAKHTKAVSQRFTLILDECRRGVRLSDADRARYGMLKHRTFPMSPAKPAPTLTTLPDDVLHYSEPRILTVREYARLQSFPDWFRFKGKYTTGGDQRKKDCPRYTQIGNAVPPLLAQGVAHALIDILQELTKPRVLYSPSQVRIPRETVALTV
jgi:DNA (cytosine-5)-methyltransferase 1